MRLVTRGCVRCQGDMARVDDIGDSYYSCVQCGSVSYSVPVRQAPVTSIRRAPEDAPRAA